MGQTSLLSSDVDAWHWRTLTPRQRDVISFVSFS